jgi:hypothetical protein
MARLQTAVRPGAAIVLAALLAFASVAQAQQSPAAETLFEQGRELLAAGKLVEACDKFAESQRLDPAVGTLLNLGDCYARRGKTATAWATFKLAASTARSANQPQREKLAQARVAELELAVPILSISIPHELPGLEVRRDGIVAGRAEWSSPIRLDPGDHEIVVSAPGRKPWSSKVTLPSEGQTTSIEVPELEVEVDELAERAPVKPASAAANVDVVMAHDRNVQHAVGVVIAGVGVLTMVVGIPLGLRAISFNKASANQSECPTATTCTAMGATDSQTAQSNATASSLFFSAGGVVLVAGAITYLTAPRAASHPAKASVRFAPSVGRDGASLGMTGSW